MIADEAKVAKQWISYRSASSLFVSLFVPFTHLLAASATVNSGRQVNAHTQSVQSFALINMSFEDKDGAQSCARNASTFDTSLSSQVSIGSLLTAGSEIMNAMYPNFFLSAFDWDPEKPFNHQFFAIHGLISGTKP